MYVLTIVFTGVAVGALARFLIADPSFESVLTTIALGAAGALLAGLVGRWLGFGQTHPLPAMAIAIFGAAAALLIHRLLFARRALR